MADIFTRDQGDKLRELFRKYTSFNEDEIHDHILDIHDLITDNVDNDEWLLWDEDFKQDVDWQEFFVEFINIITITKGAIQITKPNKSIMHFTWHYGEHNNIYRIKCFAFDSDSSLQWQLQKKTDYWHNDHSDDETEDEGMKYNDIHFQDDDDWDEDWDEGLRSNLNNQSNSMHTIISAIESMHTRLCKLGV